MSGANHPATRVINTDKYAGYPSAIAQLKAEGALEENCRHRPVQYLNNVLEQDHRAIKRRVRASQQFRSFWGVAFSAGRKFCSANAGDLNLKTRMEGPKIASFCSGVSICGSMGSHPEGPSRSDGISLMLSRLRGFDSRHFRF